MAVKKETKKKKILVSNGEGQVHIFANANNTLVTLTDSQGNALAQSSAGARGNRGAKKTTPFASICKTCFNSILSCKWSCFLSSTVSTCTSTALSQSVSLAIC